MFSGTAELKKETSAPDNRTFTDVYQLDFSAFSTPGTYRVYVDGVGCSFPFEIGSDVWKSAFIKSMRGLYGQRSGIALGPPYTKFVRPRGFHPDDGVKVYVSEPPTPNEDATIRELDPELQEQVDAYNAKGRFGRWVSNLKNEIVQNAWGGYMDAGDWDRRPDHALMPLMMFDLAEMFPDTFSEWKFNIPESEDEIPDLVNEALWLVDFYKRMQLEDGSVYGAIESGEHPRRGECSWQESLPIFAYSRTKSAAYNYAAIGARAAYWFKSHGMQQMSDEYRESAQRAFEWAESREEPAGRGGFGSFRGGGEGARCLAAAEMFRLTGDQYWHDIFLSLTRFRKPGQPFLVGNQAHARDPQGLAGWAYLQTEQPGLDQEILQNIRQSMLNDADQDVEYCMANEFHWTRGAREQIRWGALSVPECNTLVRAHYITGEDKYLDSIVMSALSGAGANPLNMCFTTGIGSRFPQNPRHNDAINTHQPLYEGVTVGGPMDPTNQSRGALAERVEAWVYPDARTWPPTEFFFDCYQHIEMNEFTVHQIMLPVSFAWGYLAAR